MMSITRRVTTTMNCSQDVSILTAWSMDSEFAPAQSHMAKDSGPLATWGVSCRENGQVAKRTGLAMWVVKF